MIDYSEAKIYKIIDNTNDNIYIGSTCQKLSQRLSEHVRHFRSYKKDKKVSYVTSFKIIENGDYDIILIKEYPCETKEQLLKKERYYIEKYKCVNKNIPGRTMKEYCKEYRENNKDLIKEYREANKDVMKQYYENNKDLIKERITKIYHCICGSEIQLNEKSRHFKTNKHIDFINNQTN